MPREANRRRLRVSLTRMEDLPPLLLLSSSRGFGGGIERTANAVERCWPGPLRRVDLYRRERVARAEGRPGAKVAFGARALVASLRSQDAIALALHIGLLPVLSGVGRVTSGRRFVLAHGT